MVKVAGAPQNHKVHQHESLLVLILKILVPNVQTAQNLDHGFSTRGLPICFERPAYISFNTVSPCSEKNTVTSYEQHMYC